MKKLIIKIGLINDMKKELTDIFKDPEKGKRNTHTLYLKNSREFYEILSPQRLELLRYITGNSFEKNTISELAKKLKRKQEAVSRDAGILSNNNLLKKIKENQKTYLKANYDSLQIKLTN